MQLSQTRIRMSSGNLTHFTGTRDRHNMETERERLNIERFNRMIWVSIIVLIMTFGFFGLVKTMIDCANNSTNEINKMRDAKARTISENLKNLGYLSQINSYAD